MTLALAEPLHVEPPDAAEPSQGARARARFRANRPAVVGALVVLALVLIALLAPLVAPYDPAKTNFLLVRKPPSALNLLGTDELGRDVLSRLIYGARASLLAAVVSVSIALAVGVPLGLLAAVAGGWVDALISRVIEAALACPFLILAIALAATLGPSLTNAMITIGAAAAPFFARLARSAGQGVMREDYVEGARAIGLGPLMIGLRHVLPNVAAPLLVQAMLATANAITAEASLSFLGLGQQPPAPSWGSTLNVARAYLEAAPWMALAPGAAIVTAVLAFNLMGDGLRDALDPRA